MNIGINPLVTVYIPSHNRSELLSRAILSVKNQTYKNIELIIFLDGCNDDSEDMISKIDFSDIYKVKVIKSITSKGACFARNRCIEISEGDYITGLDDDDLFEATRIECLLKKEHELSNKGVDHSFIYSNTKVIMPKKIKVKTRLPKVDINTILIRNCVGNQVFLKKEKLISAGLFDESLPAWQDYELWIRLIARFGDAYLDKNASYYVDVSHPHERISKSPEKIEKALNIVKNKHAGLISNRKLEILNLNILNYGMECQDMNFFEFMKMITFCRRFDEVSFLVEVYARIKRNNILRLL
ncbi:glycosyltransferase [Vibrio cholerae]